MSAEPTQSGNEALPARYLRPLTIRDAAIEQGAVLVHKDPQFKALALQQEVLPLKG